MSLIQGISEKTLHRTMFESPETALSKGIIGINTPQKIFKRCIYGVFSLGLSEIVRALHSRAEKQGLVLLFKLIATMPAAKLIFPFRIDIPTLDIQLRISLVDIDGQPKLQLQHNGEEPFNTNFSTFDDLQDFAINSLVNTDEAVLNYFEEADYRPGYPDESRHIIGCYPIDLSLEDATQVITIHIPDVDIFGRVTQQWVTAHAKQLKTVDWSGKDLYRLDFSKQNADDANLIATNLAFSRLEETSFQGAKLMNSNLANANLRHSNLSGANLNWANLSASNLTEMDLFRANLEDANLTRVSGEGVCLDESILISASLESADLTHCSAKKAVLETANLSMAKCVQADFSEANLTAATLVQAKLNSADLTRVNLKIAILVETDLTDANLTGAKLDSCKMTGVNLTGTNLSEITWKDADLSEVQFTPTTNLTGAKIKLCPIIWNKQTLDREFNHFEASKGVLGAILSISDDYLDVKHDLAKQLIRSLPDDFSKTNVQLRHFINLIPQMKKMRSN